MTTRSILARPAARPISAKRVLGQVWVLGAAIVRAHQTRRLLTEMDDRLLADVGLSRGDAMMEAARPFWALSARRRSGFR